MTTFVEQSQCNRSVCDSKQFLAFKLAELKRKESKRKEMHFMQLLSLLDELSVRRIMSFPEVFSYYCSGIKQITDNTYQEKKLLRQRFKEKLLGEDGLPVLFVNLPTTSFVILKDTNTCSKEFTDGMNDIVSECINECSKEGQLKSISPYFNNFMKLLSTNRDRSVVLWMLKRLFSNTSLEQYLFISRKMLGDVESHLTPIIGSLETKINEVKQEADIHVKCLTKQSKSRIDKAQTLLGQKWKRLSQNLIEDKEFDISNKKQRLERLQKDSKSIKRQFVSRKLHKWKSTIRSNFGNKKKGNIPN